MYNVNKLYLGRRGFSYCITKYKNSHIINEDNEKNQNLSTKLITTITVNQLLLLRLHNNSE